MRKLLTIFFLVSIKSFAADFKRDIQLFSSNVEIVNVYNDTTINGTWNLTGKILNLYAVISGSCTITNAIIVANEFTKVFDTTVEIGTGCKAREFSIMNFGATTAQTDCSPYVQKAIDQCKDRFNLYFPRGTWRTTSPLLVANYNDATNRYNQTSIRIIGEASFWDDGSGTTLLYTGNSYALGLQLNKGSEISNLVIAGAWVSPSGSDTVLYNISFANWTNQGDNGNGQGLIIDPYYDGTNSGSTGCSFHDLVVKNFNTLIYISNSSGTQNGEIMIFENIQLGNARIGIRANQPQEKMNLFRGLYSWGSIFYVYYNNSGGNYYISDLNIAGKCINIFYITVAGWFPVHITNVYAEAIGSIGYFDGFMPLSISNSVFHFLPKEYIGERNVLVAQRHTTKFNNCDFAYYGRTYNLQMAGQPTFSNSTFSGAVTGVPAATFIDYQPGVTLRPVDTIKLTNSVRMTLRKSHLSQ